MFSPQQMQISTWISATKWLLSFAFPLGTNCLSSSVKRILAGTTHDRHEGEGHSSERTFSVSICSHLVSAGTGKVGFRCPNHPVVRELLRVVIYPPLLFPSRNCPSRRPRPTSLVTSPRRVRSTSTMTSTSGPCRSSTEAKCRCVDAIGRRVCQVGIESTVIGIDCEHSKVASRSLLSPRSFSSDEAASRTTPSCSVFASRASSCTSRSPSSTSP